MVKKLNEKELDKYIKSYIDTTDDSKLCISLSLNNKKIQEWIKNGKFSHLKKELQIYENIAFGCLKEERVCHYIFFFENEDSYWRTLNLIDNLINNIKISFIKCENYKKYDRYPNDPGGSISGQYNNCSLFENIL